MIQYLQMSNVYHALKLERCDQMNKYVFDPVKPVVETKFGKLRGVTYGDVNIFMGVKYAEAKRFQMPVDQQPWEGIRNAYTYGPISMQLMPPNPPSYYRGLHMLQKQSEDCQNLNIWAPRTLNGEKKPVFVWMHGGGYFAGSALEEYSFDGFNMAHYGDIVFVSINHRLNILGHMNLADYGEEFKNSVNVGIADLVAALKWIHENIEAFGGDPDNVTICGHSGGGGKVQCMYQIEEAAPYFQRGIVLSGAMGSFSDKADENSRICAKAMLDELGITKENIEKIYEVSFDDLAAAYRKVSRQLAESGIRVFWGPIPNDYFPGFPGDVGFMPWSKDKPIIFGSTLGEFPMVKLTPEEKEAMSEEDKVSFLKGMFGAEADRLISLFRNAYPKHDILDLAYMDSMVRVPTLLAASKHAENGKDNTYVFLASYNAPEDGWVPLWHGGEVCYIFMNEDRVFALNEPIYGQKLANIFSTMALNYAKFGDPNNKYLPKWYPFTNEHRYTMIIDRECECREAYDEELVELHSKVSPRPTFGP